MEKIQTDIAIVGAGGAGLRAAIAIAETDPSVRISLISKVYPMRSHTCAAEGGAAGVIKPDDSMDLHFNDTVGGGTGCAIRMQWNTSSRRPPKNSPSWSIGDVPGVACPMAASTSARSVE